MLYLPASGRPGTDPRHLLVLLCVLALPLLSASCLGGSSLADQHRGPDISFSLAQGATLSGDTALTITIEDIDGVRDDPLTVSFEDGGAGIPDETLLFEKAAPVRLDDGHVTIACVLHDNKLYPGEYMVQVLSEDFDHNEGTESLGYRIEPAGAGDTTAPAISFDRANSIMISADTPLEISVSDASNISSFELKLDDASVFTSVPGSMDYSYVYTLLNNSPGGASHILKVIAVDAAGNTASVDFAFTTMPASSGTAPLVSFSGITENQSVNPGAEFDVVLSDPDDSLIALRLYFDASGLIHEQAVGSPHEFSYTFSVNGDYAIIGAHSLRVEATNDKGNVTNLTLHYNVVPLP